MKMHWKVMTSSSAGIIVTLFHLLTLQSNKALGFTTLQHHNLNTKSKLYSSSTSQEDEAKKLLEKAAQIRKQLAELEGKTLSQVEQEAQEEKDLRSKRQLELQSKKNDENTNTSTNSKERRSSRRSLNNPLVYVPETIDDQIRQSALAIERAFEDGITRQTVRLALVKQNEMITPEEEEWPGGAMQMYREAGRPLTEALLGEIRAVAKNLQTEEEKNSGKENYPPTVKAQDIWDFDVSPWF